MSVCNFIMAWVGPCKEENCTKHKDLKCVSCKRKATHSCSEAGSLVCGAPLCSECEHKYYYNGMRSTHGPKQSS